MDESIANAEDHVNNPNNPAMIKRMPAMSGLELGCLGCWFCSGL